MIFVAAQRCEQTLKFNLYFRLFLLRDMTYLHVYFCYFRLYILIFHYSCYDKDCVKILSKIMNEYVDVDLYGPRIAIDVHIQVRGFNISVVDGLVCLLEPALGFIYNK